MSRTVVLVLGLGLVLLVAEPGAADGGVLPPVPTVTVPPVPTVTLPPVPTVPPVVTVPAVPTVTVPPAVTDVPAPVPSVELPDVASSVPSVGQATPLGSGGRPAPNAAARGDRAAGPSRDAGRAGAQPSGRGSAGRAASGARAGTARAAGGRATGGKSRGRAARSRSRSPEVRRRERRLRQAVVRYRGCLDGLPALERRVLVLRSGVGSGRARTRARVGRALDLSARRVGRIERRGLRRLRGLGDGGCGGGGAAPSAGAPVELPADGFGRAAMAAMTFGGGEPVLAAAPEAERIEVKGERESSPERNGAPRLAPPAAAEPPGAVVSRRGGGTDLTVPLLGIVLLLGVAFATRYAPRSPRP